MKNLWLILFLVIAFGSPATPYADAPEGQAGETAEEQAAFDAATIKGPAAVDVKNEATIALPSAYNFLKTPQAAVTMKKMGNRADERLVGLIWSRNNNEQWLIVVDYEDSGYVSDTDSSKIDADKILEGMKQGAAETNKEREALGMPTLEVKGWIEPPHYDPVSHDLIWSIEASESGANAMKDDTLVNYNTRVLGRDGYVSLNLITSRSQVETDKPVVTALLHDLKFDQGKRYEDFNAKTDKVAEYGVLALIGGIAAHKLGFFAIVAAFAAKFVKVWIFAALGGFAALKNYFKRKFRRNG